jgi:protease-4
MKRLLDLIFSFLQGFMRWLGVGMALLLLVATYSALAENSNDTIFKVHSFATKGFEVTPWKGQSSILLIKINQVIGGPFINAEKIRLQLQATQSGQLKNRIKGILLEIDSGGGESNNSEAIYHMLNEFKKLYRVPVHAFVNGFCCSGAYMIACSSDKISASEYSTVGSIGVRMQQFNAYEALKKVGIQSISFKQGIGKDALNAFEPLNEEDRKFINPLLESTYDRFLNIVAKNRPLLTIDKLRNQLGAKIFDSKEGLEIGYIDAIVDNRSSALSDLASQVQLGEGYSLVELRPVMGLADWMSNEPTINNLLYVFNTVMKSLF